MSVTFTDPSALAGLIERILIADGCSPEEARAVGGHLVDASLCGHDSHGIIRIVRYHHWLKTGRLNAGRDPTVLADGGSLVQLDGGDGMGQWLAGRMTELGISRAREHGSAVMALRRAGHVGRVGAYAEQACTSGCISIHFVNVAGSRLVAPFGAMRRCISTAPVAIGVPNGDGDDFILDFATSMVAEGKALVAGHGGTALPDGALIDGEGRLTSDPNVLYGSSLGTAMPDPRCGPGALRAMGEHKGSGLALACELLAGALTGNGTNGPTEHRFGNGMLSVFIDPDAFDGRDGFAREVCEYVDYVRGSPPAEGTEQVLIPGDKERALRRKRSEEGLPVPETVMSDIFAIARELSIEASADGLAVSEPQSAKL